MLANQNNQRLMTLCDYYVYNLNDNNTGIVIFMSTTWGLLAVAASRFLLLLNHSRSVVKWNLNM